MTLTFDAYVAAALFPPPGSPLSGEPVFALGDGTVRFQGLEPIQAHDGAVLCAVAHPSGDGIVTGGDDGRLVWTTRGGAKEIAAVKGRWIDAVDAAPQTGLIAFCAGRAVHVRDIADPGFARSFEHERSVAALAFDPRGRRLAAASYGGLSLWYAKIADQKPQALRWAGSHVAVAFSPDGRFVLSAMQENALHGWRLADARDLRMGGYPAKPKSLAFFAKGALMATSGANGAVVWPFAGAGGPMGKEAVEIGAEEGVLVTRVAGASPGRRLCAGRNDGKVWTADLGGAGIQFLREDAGAPISALSMSEDGKRLAWGAEDGAAGVVDLQL